MEHSSQTLARPRTFALGILACLALTVSCATGNEEAGPDEGRDALAEADSSGSGLTVTERSDSSSEAGSDDTGSVGFPEPAPEAGTLVSSSSQEAEGFQAWTITYLSTGVDGEPVEVSGRVLAPLAGAEGASIVAWTHGTTGIADMCAPSTATHLIPPAPEGLVEAGFVVVVTDYVGLGTNGSHPYLVGPSAAASTIDIVRAATELGVGQPGRFAVAGLSQGGHAALWTGQGVSSYAPELELVGVVAAAPAANLQDLMSTVGTGAQGFAIMAAHGMSVAYHDVDLADYFTPGALDVMNVLENGCLGDVFQAFRDVGYDDLVKPDRWDGATPLGPLGARLGENSPGATPIGAPVLFVQGEHDNLVPRSQTEALHQQYCSQGTNAEYRLYLGRGHADVVDVAGGETVAWLADRFTGVAPADGCAIIDPDLQLLADAESTPAAVDGEVLAEERPRGYDTLTMTTTGPQREACPGVNLFAAVSPSAFSRSIWVVNPAIGPRLDTFVAQFASGEEAAAAFDAAGEAYATCGSFFDPYTAAFGDLDVLGDPGLGQLSIEYVFSGAYSGIPVNRIGYLVLVDDAIHASSQTTIFVDAEPAVPQEALGYLGP